MIQRLSIILLVGVILFCGGYLMFESSQDQAQVEPNLELPVITGKQIASTTYNQQGALLYTIEAAELNYYANSGDTVFDEPVVELYRDGKDLEWRLSANVARLDKSQNLLLDGNVRLFNLYPDAGIELIKSDDLGVALVEGTFSTESSVVITGPGYENSGVGLDGDFNNYNARLLNEVKGRYEAISD
uniref:LPS export ABC transporter periplasmic protein LptC n=1 Tax=Thaumasiovibrio occultus TaxID=1891184 RepID=UPI000B34C2CA|nr:LPS export ABC transporter periplasmic protein LptC [Thaumasiovibrio occultus]